MHLSFLTSSPLSIMIFVCSPRIDTAITSIGVTRLKSAEREVSDAVRCTQSILKVVSCLVESLVEKTRMYWPYMAVFVIGACLASLFLACCSCQQARKAMFSKKKPKGNFESKPRQSSILLRTRRASFRPHLSEPQLSSQICQIRWTAAAAAARR